MKTRQLGRPVEHLSLNPSNRLAEDVFYQYKGGRVVLDPPYQRGDVWTGDQRLDLMYSYLAGYPTGTLILNDRMRAAWSTEFKIAYAVIDGKQRLTTVIMWFDGDLAIPASWIGDAWIRGDVEPFDTDDGPYVTVIHLTETGQRKVASRMQLPVVTAQVDSLEAEAEIYRLVNAGGTAHTAEDLARAADIETK
jgi:Protein of unknown function DUF262